MAEETVEKMLKKYLGISAPRIVIGILMVIFGILIIVMPYLVALLIGLYLLISGILTIYDEVSKGKKVSRS